jgi:hypothetical protein
MQRFTGKEKKKEDKPRNQHLGFLESAPTGGKKNKSLGANT